MGKYISKKKKKKVWKPMETLPINKDVWLVFNSIEGRTDLDNRIVIGRTCNSWTGNMLAIGTGNSMSNKNEFSAWAKVKKPINYH